jgi:hypothetical protein
VSDVPPVFSSLFGKSQDRAHRPRAAERFAVTGMRCALGEVVDLSARGLRVRFSGGAPLRKGDSATLNVCSDSQCVKVTARVVWVRKGTLGRGGEIGFNFVNVKPGVAAALVQLGRFGFISADGARAEASAEPAAASVSGAAPVKASIEVEDLYALLEVASTATDDQIRVAYHRQAQLWHPDRNPSAEAAVKFAAISKAWKVLRNADTRAKYDQLVARCQAA